MIQGIIYCAISPSGKKYYGKSIYSIRRRKNQHKNAALRNSPYFFHRALQKYGINNFIWDIIETYIFEDKKVLINKLSEREIYWISHEKTNLKEFGYNMTKGGDGGDFNSGKIWSKETKEKMSKSRRGIKFSKEHKQNLSLSIKFVKDNASEDEKKKRHEYLLGGKNGMYGKIPWNKDKKDCYSEETLKSIRDNTKLAMQNPEVRKKYKENMPSRKGENNGMYGINHTMESRKKIGGKIQNIKKIKCLHCLKDYYPWHYSRSHGDKCKSKIILSIC